MKICTKCKEQKSLEQFYKSKNTKDGLAYTCIDCQKLYHSLHKDHRNALSKIRSKQHFLLHKEEYHQRHKKNYEDKLSYYQKKHRENIKLYRSINPHIIRHQAAVRRAAKLQATPKWANLKAIKQFYKNCPDGCHVDHIVPLKGRNVCGLHTLENLQYLTVAENLKKNNKF